ncbi:MAG: Ig-like domain-containing protein [Gemmatimonadota bacterium]
MFFRPILEFRPALARRVILSLTLLLGLSCTDGSLPVGWEEGERIPTTLLLSPTLSGPALATGVATLPVNRIRLTAFHANTNAQLGQTIVDVDPAADGWEVPVEIGLLDEGSVPVVVLVEMINVGSGGIERVVFSGRTGVIQARPGGNTSVSQVPVFPGSPGNLSITSVEIQGAPESLVEGSSVQLQVEVVGAEGEAEVFWSALDPGVAGVTTEGLVEALLPGAARMEAAAGPRADTVTIIVTPRVDGVQVTPGDAVVDALDETVPFQAQAVDPRGDVIPGTVFSWTVGDPAVAEHMGDGVFRAVGPGSTEVSAEAAGVVGQGTFQVDPSVQTLSVAVESLRLEALGATATLSATPQDRNGFPVAGAQVTWVTSDASVVSVGEGGEVTAQGMGNAVVTGTAGDAQAAVQVEVVQVVTEVRVDPASLLLQAIGATGTFQATPVDANGHPVVDAVVTWASSETSVVTVSPAGEVTAVAAGNAQVTATSGGVSGSAAVMVEQIPAAVSVTPSTSTLQTLGLTTAFSAQVTDANRNIISGAAVSWTSSNPAVASVAPTGVATAEGNGTSTISASFGGVSGSASLTVAQAPDAVAVTPSTSTLQALGLTTPFSAQVTDANGNLISGAVVTWTSSNPAVASVAPTGVATAQGNGTSTISASFGGVSGSGSLTVAQVPASVSVSPPTAALDGVGSTVTLSAEVLDSGGSEIPGATLTWGSTDPEVATVDGTGLVTAQGTGTATISAASGEASGSATVSVTADPEPDFVIVSPDPLTLEYLGAQGTLSADVRDAGENPIPGASVTWTSDDAGIASVDPEGVVTAVAVGQTSITATTSNGAFGTSTVTVTQVPATVTLDPTSLSFTYLGEATQLAATVLDAGGSTIPSPSISWESTDTEIAMVDGTGLVTAQGEGEAQITAQAGDATDVVDVFVNVAYTEDPYEANDDLPDAWDIDDVEVAGELNAATGSPGLPFESVWDPGPGGFNPDPDVYVGGEDGMTFLEYLALDGHSLGAPFLHEGGDEDYFRFEVTAPGIYTMRVLNRTEEEGSAGADRTTLRVLNAVTEEERLHWTSSGPGATGLLRSHLAPGEYAVRIHPSITQTQPLPYTLWVEAGGATPTPDYMNGKLETSLEPNDFSTFAGALAPVSLRFDITGNLTNDPGPYYPDVDLYLIPETGLTVEVSARNPFSSSQQVNVRFVVRQPDGTLEPYGSESVALDGGDEGVIVEMIPSDDRDYFVEVIAFGGSPYDLCVRGVESSCYGYAVNFDGEVIPATAAAGSTISLPMWADSRLESPYPGARIRITTSDGLLSNEVVLTDNNGAATVELTLPATAGTVTVTASLVGGASDEIEINVVPANINWVAGSDQNDTNASNLAVSEDGLSWYELVGAPIGAVESVAWGGPGAGGSLWVAVGGPRHEFDWEAPMVTSPDGIEWTPRASTGLDYAWRVAYGEYEGEPSWLVLGWEDVELVNSIHKSTDGVSWTALGTGTPGSPPAGSYVDLAFGDGLWVVLNSLGEVSTYSLSNGWSGWTSLTFSSVVEFTGVTFTGSEFVVLWTNEGIGQMSRSSDGVNWTTENVSPGGDSFINPGRIRWDGMSFRAPFGGNPGEMGVSSNGANWTRQNLPHSDAVMDVAFDPGANRWVSAGTGTFSLATSTDGTTWTGVSTHWEAAVEGRPWASTVAHRTPFYPLGLNSAPVASINQPTDGGTYYWSGSPDNIPLDGSGTDPDPDDTIVDPSGYLWYRDDTDELLFTGPTGTLDADAFPADRSVTIRLEVTDSNGAVGVDRVQIYISGC